MTACIEIKATQRFLRVIGLMASIFALSACTIQQSGEPTGEHENVILSLSDRELLEEVREFVRKNPSLTLEIVTIAAKAETRLTAHIAQVATETNPVLAKEIMIRLIDIAPRRAGAIANAVVETVPSRTSELLKEFANLTPTGAGTVVAACCENRISQSVELLFRGRALGSGLN